MSIAETLRRTIEVGEVITGEGPLAVAVEISIPAQLASSPVAFFCLPGGGLTKEYFNLEVPGAVNYSFAQNMAAHGCITVAIDHLGIGASTRPRDGFALTPEVMVEANARVVDRLKTELQQGTLSSSLSALPDLRAIGVGHSMGALVTLFLQAHCRSYDAVVILGFSTNGLRDYLTEDERAYIDDPIGARANIVRLVKSRGDDPYPELNTRGMAREIYGGDADREAVAALAKARAPMLSVMGYLAMVPGSSSDICAQIDVPVLAAVGDSDIVGPVHRIPASFTGSADVSLLIVSDMGHTHFIFPSCVKLYERLAQWAQWVGVKI